MMTMLEAVHILLAGALLTVVIGVLIGLGIRIARGWENINER